MQVDPGVGIFHVSVLGCPACQRLSVPSALDHNGPRHNIVHSPVVLEEEESDEDGEEESNGEVLVECSHCGPAEETGHG